MYTCLDSRGNIGRHRERTPYPGSGFHSPESLKPPCAAWIVGLPCFFYADHDLHPRWRYEKQGSAQSRLKWGPPKGGLQLGARPGGKDLLGKNHEAASVSWPGRANPPSPPRKGFSPRRGDRPVAPSARLILRKPVEASWRRAHPADAFYPESRQRRDPGPQPKHPGIVKL